MSLFCRAAAQATAAEKKGKKIKVEAKTQKEVAATVGDAPKAGEHLLLD